MSTRLFNNITGLLTKLIPIPDRESFHSGISEVYHSIKEEKGEKRAGLWLIRQFLKSFPVLIMKIAADSLEVMRSYIRNSYRVIIKHPGISTLNIVSLVTGIAACMLIFLWVNDELKVDANIKNSKNIYRVVHKKLNDGNEVHNARTPIPLFKAVTDQNAEVLYSSRFMPISFRFLKDNIKYSIKGGLCDPAFMKIFNIALISKNTTAPLSSKKHVLISRETALKIFGNENPTGQVLTTSWKEQFEIVGVFKKPAGTNHISFDFLIPMIRWFSKDPAKYSWDNINNPHYTYITLKNGTAPETINNRIENLYLKSAKIKNTEPYLQPLEDIYLKSSHLNGNFGKLGNILYIYLFSFLAATILFIAIINFVNLTTARAATRIQELNIRRTLGAGKSTLILQLFTESSTLTLTSIILSIPCVIAGIPWINNFTGKMISFSDLFTAEAALILTATFIITIILSGLYPAYQTFSMSLGRTAGNLVLRKSLVVVQFAISVALIFGSVSISKQLNYIRNKSLGFDKEQLLYLDINDQIKKQYNAFRNVLLKNPGIINISTASHELTDVSHKHGRVFWSGMKNPKGEAMDCLIVGNHFISTMGMKLKSGRDFPVSITKNKNVTLIINEKAAEFMGMKNPLGKNVRFEKKDCTIIGVVEDFHFKPLHKSIEPMILRHSAGEPYYLYIRIRPSDVNAVISHIRKTWEQFSAGETFECKFLSEEINRMYNDDRKSGEFLGIFTLMAIILSCLGLFGLASFTISQRKKEIGIRKVLGASVTGIIVMITGEYSKLIVISTLLAWPVAYLAMKSWLENFTYHTTPGVWSFVISGAAILISALLTITYQTLRSALSNPVTSIRQKD